MSFESDSQKGPAHNLLVAFHYYRIGVAHGIAAGDAGITC